MSHWLAARRERCEQVLSRRSHDEKILSAVTAAWRRREPATSARSSVREFSLRRQFLLLDILRSRFEDKPLFLNDGTRCSDATKKYWSPRGARRARVRCAGPRPRGTHQLIWKRPRTRENLEAHCEHPRRHGFVAGRGPLCTLVVSGPRRFWSSPASSAAIKLRQAVKFQA